MNCNVVKDLIPLYIDGCCSKESEKIVKEHIESCDVCKRLLESMNTSSDMISVSKAPVVLSKINDWKASVLQSVLLFLSFAMVTIGVVLEAKTPSGSMNGFWALNLIIPATGFMLSLANWYFVRLYKNRKRFSNCSLLATLGITICAYVWGGIHYETNFSELFAQWNFIKLNGIGISIVVFFCILSKTLSNQYAKMLGKE